MEEHRRRGEPDHGPRPSAGRGQGSATVNHADDAGPLRRALRPRGPVRFEKKVLDEGGPVRLQIVGELDVLTTPKLAAELNTLVRRCTQDVIVDLRGADFIDSAGLQILLSTRRRLSGASRTLTVVCDDGPVRRLIEMTRLGDMLGLNRGDA